MNFNIHTVVKTEGMRPTVSTKVRHLVIANDGSEKILEPLFIYLCRRPGYYVELGQARDHFFYNGYIEKKTSRIRAESASRNCLRYSRTRCWIFHFSNEG